MKKDIKKRVNTGNNLIQKRFEEALNNYQNTELQLNELYDSILKRADELTDEQKEIIYKLASSHVKSRKEFISKLRKID